jgi:hypothetical protein
VRVQFFRPTDEAETARHLALMRHIEAFWSELPSLLEGRNRTQSIQARLLEVHPGLVAELLRQDDGVPLFIVSSDGPGSASVVADALAARAPALGRVRVCRHRPPGSPEQVFAEVAGRFGVDLRSAEVRAGFGRGHLVEVVVYSHEFTDGQDERALDAGNFAVMSLLGEVRFDEWVGAVDVAPGRRPGSLRVVAAEASAPKEERHPLHQLASVMDAAVAGVLAGLPAAPCHAYCEQAEWTLLDVQPGPANDYPQMNDLVHVATMLPEMLKCFLSGARFSSARFSRHGETFVYVKIDARGLEVDARQALRLELEDRLNYALVPGRIGCVVGAGLGLRHVYLVLALANSEVGLALAQRTVAAVVREERAWLLFCDTHWGEEWIGIRDEAPPPFGEPA